MDDVKGRIVEINDSRATVALDDGSERTVEVPELIYIEVGMPVTITDFGDGKPLYGWGR